jgi:hypothetical protein
MVCVALLCVIRLKQEVAELKARMGERSGEAKKLQLLKDKDYSKTCDKVGRYCMGSGRCGRWAAIWLILVYLCLCVGVCGCRAGQGSRGGPVQGAGQGELMGQTGA